VAPQLNEVALATSGAAGPPGVAMTHGADAAGDTPGAPVATTGAAGGAAAPARGPALHVAIVAANAFEYDSRLLRTARALAADGHRVTVIALAVPGLPRAETLTGGIELRRVVVDRRITSAFRPLPPAVRRLLARLLGFDPAATALPVDLARGADRLRAPLRRFVEILAHQRRVGPWREAVLAAAPGVDAYHCKALIALPVARGAAARSGATFVYDVADLHTEAARLARMPVFVRALVRRREARWVRDAAFLTAVSDGVAREAARRFGVVCPVVAMNCPPAWRPDEPGPAASDRLRVTLGIPADRPVILYQGGFSVDRGIEELMAAAALPQLRDIGAAVVLLGYGRLRARIAAEAAARPGELFVLDAVPQSELLEWTASADLGFVGQPPRTLNQRLNLANKLFESVMAGVPVLVAEGTEHCRVVTADGLGRCCDVSRPAAIADAAAGLLRASPAERLTLRAHCRAIALERYTWERQQSGLVAEYRALAVRRAGSGAKLTASPSPGDAR
jgi:glycosyltransferase involved in cell wall biosynthesis